MRTSAARRTSSSRIPQAMRFRTKSTHGIPRGPRSSGSESLRSRKRRCSICTTADRVIRSTTLPQPGRVRTTSASGIWTRLVARSPTRRATGLRRTQRASMLLPARAIPAPMRQSAMPGRLEGTPARRDIFPSRAMIHSMSATHLPCRDGCAPRGSAAARG